MVTAVEAGVPNTAEAWKVMTSLAGDAGPNEYCMELVPRPAPAPCERRVKSPITSCTEQGN